MRTDTRRAPVARAAPPRPAASRRVAPRYPPWERGKRCRKRDCGRVVATRGDGAKEPGPCPRRARADGEVEGEGEGERERRRSALGDFAREDVQPAGPGLDVDVAQGAVQPRPVVLLEAGGRLG